MKAFDVRVCLVPVGSDVALGVFPLRGDSIARKPVFKGEVGGIAKPPQDACVLGDLKG